MSISQFELAMWRVSARGGCRIAEAGLKNFLTPIVLKSLDTIVGKSQFVKVILISKNVSHSLQSVKGYVFMSTPLGTVRISNCDWVAFVA